jgi:tetratricopeptide (TPR) repeat protein
MAVKSIESALAGPSAGDYFSAASYYRSTGKDLNKALEWVTKAVDMNPEAFWMSRQKSLIQADLGDKKGAIATAQKSMEVAQKAGNDDYVKMNKESIAEWSK